MFSLGFLHLLIAVQLFTVPIWRLSAGQVINVKPLHKACNPDALIPECGNNAICARVPRCQLGVCICRLDGNYIQSRRNNFECEQPPPPPPIPPLSLCGIISSLKKRRSLCSDDFGNQQSSSDVSMPSYHHQLSGKLLDIDEDCRDVGSSKCNGYKGLTCDSLKSRCYCEWPHLEKEDGICYTAGYNEPCQHDHECDWMYRGTEAGERTVSGNAICDEAIQRCRCNKGYTAVPRLDVNYYLPVLKPINEIDVIVRNVSVLISTTPKNQHEQLSTNYVCLKDNLKPRVRLGSKCSYLLTMVPDPVLCDSGLVCQYCPQEKEDGERQLFGTCVTITSDNNNAAELAAAAKAKRAEADFIEKIVRIVLSVGIILIAILISVAIFLLWRRHHHQMESITASAVRAIGWKKRRSFGDGVATPNYNSGNNKFVMINNSTQQSKRFADDQIIASSKNQNDETAALIINPQQSLAPQLPSSASRNINEVSRV